MNLDTVIKSLEVKIGGAPTTNQLTWAVHYTDIDQTSIAVTAISEADGLTNGVTAATMVAAPSAGKTRRITEVTIENTDTTTQTVTVQINDNGTLRLIVVIGLAAGSTLQFSGAWSIIPAPGGTAGPTGATGAQGLVGATVLIEGEQGEEAYFGPPGSQGISGPQGIQGRDGPPVLLEGEPGEEAFFGIQGPAGPQGTTVAPRVTSITSSTTPTPNADTTDAYDVTALAAGATFGAPTGSPVNFQKLIVRIKDNASPQTLAWNAAFIAGGAALPTTTVASKILSIGFIYNTANALNKWQCVATAQEA